MPLEVLTEEEANTIGKTPFSEVISFIVSECDDAANNLPDSYVNEPGAEIGRVTKGFAMAVKSKALLYAASKLHNPSMDTELWKKSAKAAIDIINTGLYSLDPQESANNLDSKEVVLIYHLVKEKGMTLPGARQRLKDNKEATVRNYEIVNRLKGIKEELLAIKKELDGRD